MRELFASAALVALLVLLLNPLHFWMPTKVQILIVTSALAAFAAAAVFALRERAEDEREEAHRSFAGRIAFLTGSAILVLGIIVQSFDHAVDAWLVLTLVAMIFAKFTARFYSDRNF